MKARAIAAALGEPAIADDSGIEVDALGGAPGPRSARFAGEDATDAENLAKLIEAGRRLAGRAPGPPATDAWPRSRGPDGRTLHAEGTCEGTLVTTPRGERRVRLRPDLRAREGEDRTMAELSDEEKDRISHRGRAFRALAGLLSP